MGGDDDAADIDGPAPGGVGLLLVDVINPLDFPGAERLAPEALKTVEAIRALREEADRLSVPTIYVNDNYGHWGSEKSRLIEEIRSASPEAEHLAAALAPRDGDFFVIKPQFSGFYATNLPVLLPKLGVSRLVLAGFAGDICILFTAADAHMRDYDLWVPANATASETPDRLAWALEIMRQSMSAETAATDALALGGWLAKSAG